MSKNGIKNFRNVAIVGPYSSGKTTLLESILFVTNAITRKGNIKDGNTVSDSSAEARDRSMSVELSVASTEYQEIDFTFLDCPGSVEFTQETYNALVGAGTVIIVCEPVIDKVLTLAPLFKFLDDWEIPHLVFINKIDRSSYGFMEILQALKRRRDINDNKPSHGRGRDDRRDSRGRDDRRPSYNREISKN